MLDFVFAVDDPITWHTMNLIENRKHYSFLKYLGPKHIGSIQNDYGARVYYNTLVPSEERVSFCSDIMMWLICLCSVFQCCVLTHHPKQHWRVTQLCIWGEDQHDHQGLWLCCVMHNWSVEHCHICKLSCKTKSKNVPLQLIKYGVISTDALIDDLLHWKTMYIAGRLHKPVRFSQLSLFSNLITWNPCRGKKLY